MSLDKYLRGYLKIFSNQKSFENLFIKTNNILYMAFITLFQLLISPDTESNIFKECYKYVVSILL